MNENLKMITDSLEIVKSSCVELCESYCDLCALTVAPEILSVLDGNLRLAIQIQNLENFFTNGEECATANEYEVKKFLNMQKA